MITKNNFRISSLRRRELIPLRQAASANLQEFSGLPCLISLPSYIYEGVRVVSICRRVHFIILGKRHSRIYGEIPQIFMPASKYWMNMFWNTMNNIAECIMRFIRHQHRMNTMRHSMKLVVNQFHDKQLYALFDKL